jgi:LmbE family N-acetylglucosaminyl deacetylase
MKNISRRNMIRLSGVSALGTLTGVQSFSKTAGKSKTTDKKLKIIVAGAHPDDPESGCGGTMALFSAIGHEVVSAYLTRGEAGIPGKSHEEAASIRTAEALKACKILGARAEFLGQIDGSTEITKDRYDDIYKFFEKENPDIIFTHWPVDTHRDHRICSILVYDAWLNLGKKSPLYYFEVESGIQTQNFSPSEYINIGPVITQKTASCMAHASQDPEDFYQKVHRKMEEFRGMESNCEFAEAFVGHNQNPQKLIIEQ